MTVAGTELRTNYFVRIKFLKTVWQLRELLSYMAFCLNLYSFSAFCVVILQSNRRVVGLKTGKLFSLTILVLHVDCIVSNYLFYFFVNFHL